MKIMHTMASEAPTIRAKRRFYSLELKAQVMRECGQSGASVAGVALGHGINANIVHRWLRESAPPALLTQSPTPAFVPLTFDEPAPLAHCTPPAKPDIRVEVRRANASVVVNWPLEGSAACAVWLREWLR